MPGEELFLLVVHALGKRREPRAFGFQVALVRHVGDRWLGAERQADR